MIIDNFADTYPLFTAIVNRADTLSVVDPERAANIMHDLGLLMVAEGFDEELIVDAVIGARSVGLTREMEMVANGN